MYDEILIMFADGEWAHELLTQSIWQWVRSTRKERPQLLCIHHVPLFNLVMLSISIINPQLG